MKPPRALAAAVLCAAGARGIVVDLDDRDSVTAAASTVIFNLFSYYTGNKTGDVPGNLPDPYFWWLTGAMFMDAVEYATWTGDGSYDRPTVQAIEHQASETRDFMPKNQSRTSGNDDQCFWAMLAMSAAESRFPDPPAGAPQYVGLVQSVLNLFVARWDVANCGGGLRWQIFPFMAGYEYKNAISNGCFFNVAARLARYTGNETYAEWAGRVWDWEREAGLLKANGAVVDGTWIEGSACPRVSDVEWTYNAGVHLHGAAVMYNLTGTDEWRDRVDMLLEHIMDEFLWRRAGPDEGGGGGDLLVWEPRCEPAGSCNNDQRAFKGFLLRWLGKTAQLAPHTRAAVAPVLRANAAAAAASCVGAGAAAGAMPAPPLRGVPDTACGFSWTGLAPAEGAVADSPFDGRTGVPEHMNALSALLSTLFDEAPGPVTNDTGGTSRGNPGGSGGGDRHDAPGELPPITGSDRAGAGVLTAVLFAGLAAATVFVLLPLS